MDEERKAELYEKYIAFPAEDWLVLTIKGEPLSRFLQEKYSAFYDLMTTEDQTGEAIEAIAKLVGSKENVREIFIAKMIAQARPLLERRCQAALDALATAAIGEMHCYGRFIWQRNFSLNPEARVEALLPTEKEIREVWESVIKTMLIDKEIMASSHGGRRSTVTSRMHELSCIFDVVVGTWLDAFNQCRNFKPFSLPKEDGGTVEVGQWRDAVMMSHPFLLVDATNDLVERLQPMNQWSDAVLEKCSEKGGTSDAEDIALEHAARVCGAGRYEYQLSSLKEMLKEQRREAKKVQKNVKTVS